MPPEIIWAIIASSVGVAGSVWGLLAFYAHRSNLEAETRRRFIMTSGICLLGWLVLAAVLGTNGIFQATPSRAFPTLLVSIALLLTVGTFLLYRSSMVNAVLATIPLPWLMGVQMYRAVGFIFLLLYVQGRLPGEFALPAGWGDVAIGLAAPVVAYIFHKRYRWSCLAAWSWNVIGILDIAVAVSTGFLSSPSPYQTLALETPNTLITVFPLVLVPLVAVPLSILLHVAALKRLSAARQTGSHRGLKCDGKTLCWTGSLP